MVCMVWSLCWALGRLGSVWLGIVGSINGSALDSLACMLGSMLCKRNTSMRVCEMEGDLGLV